MKILVPTDFSNCAEHAATIAIDMAKQLGAKITFLHLMALPIDYVHLDDDKKRGLYPSTFKRYSRVEGQIQALIKAATNNHVTASYHIHYNESIDFINEFVKTEDINTIIMGSHGADEMKDYLFGTFTQRIVRSSKVPVLVVKRSLQKINKVALLSDFKNETTGYDNWISRLVQHLNLEFHLTYINTPMNFMDSRTLKKRIKRYRKLFHFYTDIHIYNDHQFDDGVKHFCEDYEVDLIMMDTHERKGMERAVSGGLAEKVVAQLEVPILCLPVGENKVVA